MNKQLKNVNGTTKNERMVNKAKKYLGVELVKYSNQYHKINQILENENELFVVSSESIDFVTTKYGKKAVIEGLNMQKEIWIDEWKTLPLFINNNIKEYLVRVNYEPYLKIISEAAKGSDDIELLKNVLKNRILETKWILR